LQKHSHNFTSYCSENEWTKYEFEETKDMSTYLVAFIVSDFNSLDSNAKYNFTAWARPNAIDNAAYSQDVGPRIVEYYEKFTGIEYKFPKIDQVAVPDFASGAMENWGLITYRYVQITSCNLYHNEGCATKITESF
jgi:aminopeptidase N